MDQIDMFETYGAHEISEYTQLEYERLAGEYIAKCDRRVQAAFGDPMPTAEFLDKYPMLVPGKLKFRKKLAMVQEFVLVTHDKLKASLLKKQGNVRQTGNIDPQYLINVYNHNEKLALFLSDFHDFMSDFMNAVHLFTVATVYDGRLLVYAENGEPLVTTKETLEMLTEIEHFINKSKVYRVHSQNAIYRTI
ncbi:hypothetical protein pEaSNUABM35_00308 [Erwinia phage pEa_SNUABM_35]|uniref:Uncharacterized protein n=1 Tax=Erwinia phage pEa_SNUABM_35 TaxID=2869557 RepID=A0AAE7XRC4_9CAUD|nr:hypothetical protein MPK65_gp308 [Erwinia phage pEa_SNUABM_35]QZE60225.1 hypothetical protein pEaSNUABM35_00308 [Erwinia phage pEa_SNUABM_35]QZE60561.1 hypothetical protein pEaSNUABM36_00308 [Erwinia phage pEa_SNUABM_36]